jgi:signal peptidase II
MRLKNPTFWVAALVGLILDQVTKFWIFQSFELNQTVPLLPGVFHLTFVTNKGAAFSLFSERGEWLRWLSLAVSLGLIALGWFSARMNRWEQIGYGSILAGALGNGIDRFLRNEVVDFLDFRLIQFPVFNIADVCINVGIICLLIAAFQKPPQSNGYSKRKDN